MDVENLVGEELVLFTDQKDQFLLLEEVADLLEQQGKTKATYKEAVIEREMIFPTGLETEHIGIAIPHTDSIHVNEPALAIAVLKNRVPFIQMGTDDELVGVEVLFMLALKKAEDQLEMLQVLVDLIQDETNMDKLKCAKDAAGVIECIRQFSANQ